MRIRFSDLPFPRHTRIQTHKTPYTHFSHTPQTMYICISQTHHIHTTNHTHIHTTHSTHHTHHTHAHIPHTLHTYHIHIPHSHYTHITHTTYTHTYNVHPMIEICSSSHLCLAGQCWPLLHTVKPLLESASQGCNLVRFNYMTYHHFGAPWGENSLQANKDGNFLSIVESFSLSLQLGIHHCFVSWHKRCHVRKFP